MLVPYQSDTQVIFIKTRVETSLDRTLFRHVYGRELKQN